MDFSVISMRRQGFDGRYTLGVTVLTPFQSVQVVTQVVLPEKTRDHRRPHPRPRKSRPREKPELQ
jgi:hypothetical protein